jgi:hypothetical protein
MADSPARLHLRRHLEAYLTSLGYTATRMRHLRSTRTAEVERVSLLRGRIAYGETVLPADLRSPKCHERLLFFSSRRTRHRSSIPLFIAVAEEHAEKLAELLDRLEIRNAVRGGHVRIVAVPAAPPQRAAEKRAKRG